MTAFEEVSRQTCSENDLVPFPGSEHVWHQRRIGESKWPLKRLPKRGAPILRLNTIAPYYTMFPLDFPFRVLKSALPGERVLDPFCGRGTTLYAARLRGLECTGIDSNPVAAAVSAAKLVSVSADDVVSLARAIVRAGKGGIEMPSGEFWDCCYSAETLREICLIRNYLMRQGKTPEETMLRALMLGILHGPMQKDIPSYLSNQMPRTYATKPDAAVRYWSKCKLTVPPSVDVLEALDRRARFVLGMMPPSIDGVVYCGDSRYTDAMLQNGRPFSWVITSPPYFGMRTYRPDQWLRNWFLGGPSTVDYDQDGQLPHQIGRFADELACVWQSVAQRCSSGARLIIRFGSIPSAEVDAKDLLRESLRTADTAWRIVTCKDAGSASSGRRQAAQFGACSSLAEGEFDMYARLEI